MENIFSLAGKVGIVMGAGQVRGDTIGNGRAAALVFARAGARLLLVDRSETAARETAQCISDEGGAAEILQADWTDPVACNAVAARCMALWSRVDFLHNNVGILGNEPDTTRPTPDEFHRVIEINLTGCLNSCNAILPIMRAQGVGSIVNISSIAAVASTGQLAYGLSKAALNALGRELSMLNASHGIRVNTVMPGLLNTPMAIEHKSRQENTEKRLLREKRNALIPLNGGMGSGWDTAWASLYLHSDAAKFVTGVELPVDGGQSAMVGGLMSANSRKDNLEPYAAESQEARS